MCCEQDLITCDAHRLAANVTTPICLLHQGTLAGLDSRNPVLYMDFPEGRLKFLGTLVFPKNNYMVLKFGRKEVLCEDVLENMVSSPCKPARQPF